MAPDSPDRSSVSTHFRDDHVLEDVLVLRWAMQPRPPGIQPAYERAVAARDSDDVEALDRALRELAVACLNSLSTLRRTNPSLVLNR